MKTTASSCSLVLAKNNPTSESEYAPPERGKTNRSVIKILAKTLGISPKFISIVSGETSTNKVFIVDGMAKSDILRKIQENKNVSYC